MSYFNGYNDYPYTNYQNLNLDWVLKTVKEMQERVGTLEGSLEEQIDTIVSSTLTEFKAEVKSEISAGLADVQTKLAEFQKNIQADMNSRFAAQDAIIKNNQSWTVAQITELQQDFQELQQYIDKRVSEIQRSITGIWEGLSEYKEGVDEMLRVQLNNMYTYIDERIQSITRLYVTNPITGEFEDIQKVLDMFVSYLTAGLGLTAQEYDDLQLTAFEYDSMHITAINYIVRGLYLFYPKLYLRMLSPFTGRKDDYADIIYKLADFHKNSWKAYEYDMFELTAQEYDDLQITAYQFDWNSRHWIIGTPKNAVYTASEYDAIGLTAKAYDALFLTAEEFDVASKIFIQKGVA